MPRKTTKVPALETAQPDFSAEAAPSPVASGDAVLSQIKLLATQYRRLAGEVEAAEQSLASLNRELNVLTMVTIPDAMASLNMTTVKLDNGVTVEVKPDVKVHVNAENQAAAYAWLTEQGHGTAIKTELVVDTRAMDQEERDKLLTELGDMEAEAVERQSLHPATLKSLVKEMLERGVQLPAAFSVFEYKKAAIKEPKK